ncbi:MAG: hypothetical protein AXA67_10160 [Methylothermaceae bacteria B42]|nr:MAG: hypothetical protein AXA67_10160 [Methylothermaceae bacteria B42]
MHIDLLPLALVWIVMMSVMMMPSSLPVISLFHQVSLKRHQNAQWLSLNFMLGYFGIWLVFSLILAILQWGIQRSVLLSFTSLEQQRFAAGLFIIAGLYQLSWWKNACLTRCRTPLGFIMNSWQKGWNGAISMGFKYGLICLGCCWALMLLMLGIGTMSLIGMLIITALVTAEKLLPVNPRYISGISGIFLLIWAGYLLSMGSNRFPV